MRKYSIFVASLSMFLIGCGVYHPQTTDIPLIDHKSDLRIDAGASLIPSVYSTVSYGLTKRIALQAFGSIGIENRHYLQVSPGFYKCLNKEVDDAAIRVIGQLKKFKPAIFDGVPTSFNFMVPIILNASN